MTNTEYFQEETIMYKPFHYDSSRLIKSVECIIDYAELEKRNKIYKFNKKVYYE